MKHSKSALFLMELILALLFFALASTVCIRLFSKAHLIRIQTINENHAVMHAQNLAETFLATEGDLAQMKLLLPYASETDSEKRILMLFDSNWNACTSESADYFADLTAFPSQDGLITADITIAPYDSSGETIYTLTISHHIAERRGKLEP